MFLIISSLQGDGMTDEKKKLCLPLSATLGRYCFTSLRNSVFGAS